MALQKEYKSPYSAMPVEEAYFRIVETNLNFAESRGSMTVHVYENKMARDAGKLPFASLHFTLTKDGAPAMDANGNVLVKEGHLYKNKNGEVVTPYIYEFPPFDALIDAVQTAEDTPVGTKAFDMAKSMLYVLLKTRPEFAGAVDV